MEDWAEIRRLYRVEKLSMTEIAKHLGIGRNTVSRALASDRLPKYARPARGSKVDAYEPQIRALLADFPRMKATVIAERLEFPHSISILKDRIRQIRPEYVGIDPADRTVYRPGEITQCDLWFPGVAIPVGHGQTDDMLPVLVMTNTYSRFQSAMMLPSRQGGDLTAGMWSVIDAIGRAPKTLLWDRESAIGPRGKVTVLAAAFAGTLSTRFRLAPRRDPEYKGMVERNNDYLEGSFLPGRRFRSPADFNLQLQTWLTERANRRHVRSLGGRPVDFLEEDYDHMIPLPPTAPVIGLKNRIRLARDYYVRIGSNDYSVDPRVIGKFVDITASMTKVTVRCEGELVAEHERCWASHQVIRDENHLVLAKQMRRALAIERDSRERAERHHADGHTVMLRALPDYDALFGVDFTAPPRKEGTNQ
nr:IS21 family transposase [Leifsonia sp. C5G2]